MARALFESLIMNHPFVDGYKLKVEGNKAHRFLIGLLEDACCNFDQLLPWIRKHAVEL
jgi:prophage maintenance system killer protein